MDWPEVWPVWKSVAKPEPQILMVLFKSRLQTMCNAKFSLRQCLKAKGPTLAQAHKGSMLQTGRHIQLREKESFDTSVARYPCRKNNVSMELLLSNPSNAFKLCIFMHIIGPRILSLIILLDYSRWKMMFILAACFRS